MLAGPGLDRFPSGREAHGVFRHVIIGRAGERRRSTPIHVNSIRMKPEPGCRVVPAMVRGNVGDEPCGCPWRSRRLLFVAPLNAAPLGSATNPRRSASDAQSSAIPPNRRSASSTLRNGGSQMDQALQLINREATNRSACGAAIVAFRSGEPIGSARLDGQPVNVVKITVLAFNNGGAGRWCPRPCSTRSLSRKGSRCSDFFCA